MSLSSLRKGQMRRLFIRRRFWVSPCSNIPMNNHHRHWDVSWCKENGKWFKRVAKTSKFGFNIDSRLFLFVLYLLAVFYREAVSFSQIYSNLTLSITLAFISLFNQDLRLDFIKKMFYQQATFYYGESMVTSYLISISLQNIKRR